MAEAITKSREAIALFEAKLKTAVLGLSQENQIDVEKLTTTDNYVLKHPRGIYGIIFNGDDFNRREDVKGGVVVMRRNILIGVVSIIRFFYNPGKETDNVLMMPSEYTELAVDKITGIEIVSTRPQYEAKIVPRDTTLVDEDNGIWKYLTTFSVPVDFIEEAYRD